MLAGLATKHYLCDFPLQTKKMLAQKGRYGADGGINHALAHGIGTLLIFLIYHESWRLAVILGFVDMFIHYHIDWAKVKLNDKLGLKPTDDRFWWLLGFDQYFHLITYFFLVTVALK